MPSIKIRERDLTTAGTTTATDDVVFVPGFVNSAYINADGIAPAYVPVLCTSISEFNSNFGAIPATFASVQNYPGSSNNDSHKFDSVAIPSGTSTVMFASGAMDPGYVYAKELLNAGLSVYYVRMNTTADEITVDHMYSALTENVVNNTYSIWTELQDITEYSEVKYLTTGGYPTFEYSHGAPSFTIKLNGSTSTAYSVSSIPTFTEYFNDNCTDASTVGNKVELKLDQIVGGTIKAYSEINNTDLADYADIFAPIGTGVRTNSKVALIDATSETNTTANTIVKNAVTAIATKLVNETITAGPSADSLASNTLNITYIVKGYVSGTSGTTEAAADGVVKAFRFIYTLTSADITALSGGQSSAASAVITRITTALGDARPSDSNNINEVSFSWSVKMNNIPITSVVSTLSGIGLSTTATAAYNDSVTIEFDSYIASHTVATHMLTCAASRGDCVALIDHTNNPGRTLDPANSSSVYAKVVAANLSNGEFGAMFTPWCTYELNTDLYSNAGVATVPSALPASFGYLISLADSIEQGYKWTAIAGRERGAVSGTPALQSSRRLSQIIANSYQPENAISINAITNVKPFGQTIWGNRTLHNNARTQGLVAVSFLNVRNVISDVKKIAYSAARMFMFEQNSDVLWLNFKSVITPTLDQMKTSNILDAYDIYKESTASKAKLVCVIRLYPIYAVESFDITVELTDDEITVED